MKQQIDDFCEEKEISKSQLTYDQFNYLLKRNHQNNKINITKDMIVQKSEKISKKVLFNFKTKN